jgi:hypothetical protein
MTFRVKKFKEERLRHKIARKEDLRLVLQHVASNVRLNYSVRQFVVSNLARRPRFSVVRAKNRCLYTNRAKSVIRFFRYVAYCV